MLKEGNKSQEHYVFGRNAEADRGVIEEAIGLSLNSIAQNVLSSDRSFNPNFDGIVGEILVTLKLKHPKSTISPDYIRLMLMDIYFKLFLQSIRSVGSPETPAEAPETRAEAPETRVEALARANETLEEAFTEVVWEKSSIEEIIDYLSSIKIKILRMRGFHMYAKAMHSLDAAALSLKKFGRIDEDTLANIPDYLDLRYKVESFNP